MNKYEVGLQNDETYVGIEIKDKRLLNAAMIIDQLAAMNQYLLDKSFTGTPKFKTIAEVGCESPLKTTSPYYALLGDPLLGANIFVLEN